MIKMSRRYLDATDGVPSGRLLSSLIAIHRKQVARFDKLWAYYNGDHEIINRTKEGDLPNNKVVCNHAQYITDMAVGYVHGVPVQYSGNNADALNDYYTIIDEDSHNMELAQDISIFGIGLEIPYMDHSEPAQVQLGKLSPQSAFVVCDTDLGSTPYMAVQYLPVFDLDGNLERWDIDVWTDTQQYLYHAADLVAVETAQVYPDADVQQALYNGMPVIEYSNNRFQHGDFEPVLGLIDAYNLLTSDRINDKEQFVNSLLYISGLSFGDNEEEQIKTAKLIRKLRMIELPENCTAGYISKVLSETDTEILRNAIKKDIHEFSKVPDLTDENFASNASGVAMKYKLLGFEQLGKTKEQYFKQGLRKRLAMLDKIGAIRGANTDYKSVDITMVRSLPVDDELQAKIAQETDGFVSWETRLLKYNPELDPDAERERLLEEKKEAAQIQQEAFGGYNPPISEDSKGAD